MKRRVVIRKTRLQYVLESTIKKRRKNMKLKKILAQSLAVAMVLSSVPVAIAILLNNAISLQE